MKLSHAPWLLWAANEIGKAENPSPRKSNARILEYRSIGKSWDGDEDDGAIAWCMIFVNAALEACGILGTRSAKARSPERSDKFIKLEKFVPGCIVVFWRGSKTGGLGHVGIGAKLLHAGTTVVVINGNSADAVKASSFSTKDGAKFGFIGYYWPKGVPLNLYSNEPFEVVSGVGGKVT